MKADKYGNGLVFSTGKKIDGNISLSELDSELFISYGFDGEMSASDFTKEEKIELADHMISLWNRFKGVTGTNILNSLVCESVECNCEEASQKLQVKINAGTISKHSMFNSWICPAHGYKKL